MEVSEIEMAVQINGKVKERIVVGAEDDNETIKEKVLSADKVKEIIGDKQVVKCIVVPKKLVNIVIK